MFKSNFMDLWEELSLLNEDVHSNFEKNLVPRITALEPKLQAAVKALDNPNYVEIQEILKSLISGFKICFSVSKQITTIAPNDQIINAPFDEAMSILNKLDDIVFNVNQGDTALDKYLKNKPTAWTIDDLKEALRDYEKYSDIKIEDLDFSGKETTAKQEVTTEPEQKTEPKNAKLNKARQANLKIIKAFKEIGLSTDDLTVTAKNKNGKDYRKASDKLNKLRKTLFGESLDTDEEIEIED